MQQSKRDRIAARAYAIWVEEGRPADKAAEHWRRAEQEVAAEDGAAQMGGGEPAPAAPESELDTRPAPPVKAAPPLAGADTAEAKPAEKSAKRKTGRSRRPKTESQHG